MNYHLTKLLSLLLILLLTFSCSYDKPEEGQSDSDRRNEAKQENLNFVNTVKSELAEDVDLDASVLSNITASMLAQLYATGMDQTFDHAAVAGLMLKGALIAIGNPVNSIPEVKKLSAIKSLIKSIYSWEQSNGKSDQIRLDSAVNMMRYLSIYLGEKGAKIPWATIGTDLTEITNVLVSNVDNDPIKALNIADKIVNEGVSVIIHSGAPAIRIKEIVLAIKGGVIGGLIDAEVSNEKISEKEPAIDLAEKNGVTAMVSSGQSYISAAKLSNEIAAGIVVDEASIYEEVLNSGLSGSKDLNLIIPKCMLGVQKAIPLLVPALDASGDRISVLGSALENSTIAISGKASGNTINTVLSSTFKEIIQNIDLLGISIGERPAAIGIILQSILGKIDNIPLGNTTPQSIIDSILVSAVNESFNISTNSSDAIDIVKQTLSDAISILNQTGLNPDEIETAINELSTIVVMIAAKEISENDTSTDVFNASIGILAQKITEGVSEGSGDKSKAAKVAPDIMNGILNALKEEKSTEELETVIDKVNTSVIEGLVTSDVDDADIALANTAMSEASNAFLNDLVDPNGLLDLVLDTDTISTEEGKDEPAIIGISLSKKPYKNHTITITSKDSTEGTVSPDTIEFTPNNWNIFQNVEVRSVDDGLVDETIEYMIEVTLDSGVRKLVKAKNRDNDSVGINVYPGNNPLYVSELGGKVVYRVTLNSIPKDNIKLGFAVLFGQKYASIIGSRYLTFTPGSWNVPQVVTVQGKNGGSDQHESVLVSIENIISINRTDPDYPELPHPTISLVNLDDGPEIQTFSAVSGSRQSFKTHFNYNIFGKNEDNPLIYENVLDPEIIKLSFAKNQVRPRLAMDECISSSNNNIIYSDLGAGSYRFCVSFLDTSLSYAQSWANSAVSSSYSFLNTTSCQLIAAQFKVKCTFSPKYVQPANHPAPPAPVWTVPSVFNFNLSNIQKDTIFGYGDDQKIGNNAITTPGIVAGGSGYSLSYSGPAVEADLKVDMRYAPSSIASNNTAAFEGIGDLRSGLWILNSYRMIYDNDCVSNCVSSLLFKSGVYAPGHVYYIEIP